MRFLTLAAISTLALLAACNGPEAAEQPGNQVVPSAEARTQASPSGGDLGQPVDAARAKVLVHERHERMEELGKLTKTLRTQLDSSNPDLPAIQKAAARMNELAPMVIGWYPPGTGPEAGKTHAKAEIWQKPDDFIQRSRAFEAAAKQLNAPAQSGDLAATKAAFGEAGKSCKACHDPYRSPKHD